MVFGRLAKNVGKFAVKQTGKYIKKKAQEKAFGSSGDNNDDEKKKKKSKPSKRS